VIGKRLFFLINFIHFMKMNNIAIVFVNQTRVWKWGDLVGGGGGEGSTNTSSI